MSSSVNDSVPARPSAPPDPHAALIHELVALQIETWLLEARAADVRDRLRSCRTRRSSLGRTYRRTQIAGHV